MRIEEGCLAIVVNGENPENIGKITIVGKNTKEKYFYRVGDCWEVETPMVDVTGIVNYRQAEQNLSRIKEPDENKVVETDESVCA